MIALGLMLLAQSPDPVPPFDVRPEPEKVLAEQRGGLRLPSGIDLAMAVQTQTAVDGAIVLRTHFQLDQGAPTLTAYAPRSGQIVAAPQQSGAGGSTMSPPTISFSGRDGLQVTFGGMAPPISVTNAPDGGAADVPDGLVAVPTGAATATDNGVLTFAERGGLQLADLKSGDLNITHFAGSAFGSAIANMGSDRAIDTQTTVSIDLRNAGPDVLGSAMFRVEDVALDALAMRAQ